MRPLPRILAPSLLALALVGCNNDGLAFEDLKTAQVSALCDYLLRCGVATDEALCLGDRWSTYWSTFWFGEHIPDLERLIADGDIVYHADQAEVCLQRITDAECTWSGLLAIASTAQTGACSQVFEGSAPEGSACWIDQQCVEGSCDKLPCQEACCQGVCAARTPAPLGASCGDTGCVHGTHCGDNGTCVADGALGEPCDDQGTPCMSDLQCVREGSVQTCQAFAGLGEPCKGGTCDVGLVCSGPTSTCTKIPGEGEACEPGWPTACALGLDCDRDTSTCVPLTAGMICALGTFGLDCGAGTYCVDNICQPHKPQGELCGDDFACASQFCHPQTHTCAEAPVCVQS